MLAWLGMVRCTCHFAFFAGNEVYTALLRPSITPGISFWRRVVYTSAWCICHFALFARNEVYTALLRPRGVYAILHFLREIRYTPPLVYTALLPFFFLSGVCCAFRMRLQMFWATVLPRSDSKKKGGTRFFLIHWLPAAWWLCLCFKICSSKEISEGI